MDSLLAKYFDGSISERELAALAEWIEQSDDNRRTLVDMYRLWNAIEFERVGETIDTAREWKRFLRRTTRRRPFSLRRAMALAACLTAVTVGSVIFFSKNHSAEMAELIVPHGETAELTLPDGTAVKAGAGTRLAWAKRFNGRERHIDVDGQVWLDVVPDSAHPFEIHTEAVDVKVLGTELVITAYSGETTNSVVLVSGSVAISNNVTGSRTTLSPNKMYEFDETKSGSCQAETVTEVDTAIHTSWLEGKYIFDREPFAAVMARLSSYFGVKVECDEAAGKYLCSGKLNLADGFDELLTGLTYVVPVVWHRVDGVYKIELSQ